MKSAVKGGLVVVVLLLALTVAGCSVFSSGTVATLETDLPQLASYAELFNSVSDSYKIAVSYSSRPWEAATREKDPPDLVAGAHLNGITSMRGFADLSKVLEQIGADRFYSQLLDLGRRGEDQALLPLSFELPLIIVQSDDRGVTDTNGMIDVETLRSLSAEYVADGRMGFSPRWDGDTAYLFTKFFDVDFHQTDQGIPAWNDPRLTEAVAYLHEWADEVNGGVDAEEAFVSKYLYDPPYKLVADGRIRFASSRIGTYLNIPAEIGEKVDFRWLSQQGTIPVLDDVVFIGRVRLGRNRRAATEFLKWLLQPDTQAKLLETDRYRRVRGFGIADGFSSLREVNGDAFPRFYPFLSGRIPSDEMLAFPARLPANWGMIRKEVLCPWLLEQSATAQIEEPFSERLLAWQRQRPDGS